VREILYGYSSDFGETWTTASGDRVISFADGHPVNPEDCEIALAPSGLLVVVWSEDVTDTREVHYGISTDSGLTWSSESQDLILSYPATAADTGAPSVAIGTDGAMHVVWTQTSSAGSIEVFYSASADGGATWSGTAGDRMISFPDGNGAVSPQLVAIGDDGLVAVWRETSSAGGSAIHAGISQDGGATWSSESGDREISQPANIITNLAAGADRCWGEIDIVYTASFNTQSPFHYEVYATSSYNNGQSWNGESELIPVSDDEGGGRSASNPDVFFGWGQGAVAAWDEAEDTAGTNEIHVSRGGSPWSGAAGDEIISFPDGEDGYRPSVSGMSCFISLDEGSRDLYDDTYVLWTEFAGGTTDNYEVHLSSTTLVQGSVGDTGDGLASVRAFPNPSSGPVNLRWRGAGGGGTSRIEIFDAGGRCIRILSPEAPAGLSGGDAQEGDMQEGDVQEDVSWNRLDAGGRRVSAGCYFARVRTPEGRVRIAPFVLL
jgi:hypothetical protein